jgi:hypothetical protein
VVLLRDTGRAFPVVSSILVLYIKIHFGLSTASTSRIIHLGSWKRLQIEDLLMLFITVSRPIQADP